MPYGSGARQRDIRTRWLRTVRIRGCRSVPTGCVPSAIAHGPAAVAPCADVHRPDATHRRDPPNRSATGCASPAAGLDPPLAAGDALDVDVAIVGGGFTGLWTAIALTDTDPALRIVVLEAETVAFGASGRNGGFCEASLTHGLANGIRHFPDELERLEREGIDNLAGADRVHPRARRSTATSRRPASWPSPTSRTRSRSSAPGSTRRPRTASTSSSSTATPSRRRSTPRSGRPGCTGRPVATSCSTRRSSAAGSREWHASAASGSTRGRGSPRLERRGRRRPGPDGRGGDGPGRAGRRGHLGLLGLAPPPVAAVRAGLRLRPGLGAAGARRAARRSAGRGARACPTRTTSSTTSA